MSVKSRTLGLGLAAVLLVLAGCYPNKEVTMVKKETVASDTTVNAPTKAYLLDASVVLLPNGFRVRNGTISGTGQRYWLSRADDQHRKWKIPLDSVGAMTYYEKKISGGRAISSFLLGLFGTVMTPLSIYCIACSKCCFGSCPTVYAFDGGDYHLEAELFSSSVSKYLEKRDLDLLGQYVPSGGPYQLRLTNEALETHYVNALSLIAVNHPTGTTVLPSESGAFVLVRKLVPPAAAVNRQGNDVLRFLQNSDGHSYRSDTSVVKKLTEGLYTDWLDVKVSVPKGSRKVKMVLRLRNTLLSTILFYDVVLGSQGIYALDWTERMNTDELYASQFGAIYKAFSSISVQVLRNGQWVQHTSISDVGPITWKDVGTEIPVHREGELSVRLQFIPDNFMIDLVAFDVQSSDEVALALNEVFPTEVRENSGTVRKDVLGLLEKDDDRYLVTNPGESYRFFYHIPETENGDQALFIRSKGYYTEWIRGSWLKEQETSYRFNLSEIDLTLSQLARSWLENKDLIEGEFFEARIPVKEVP